MEIFEYLLFIFIYSIYLCNTQEKCSAMDSYIRISSDIIDTTILSSQALFPPYTYYIPSTPIIMLNTNDNPCDATQITTNITNKILLVYTSDKCSDYQKTYVAQQKGAIGVLIVISTDNTVSTIPGDSTSNSTIPTRGISYARADNIQRQLQVPETAGIVYVEFGCNYKETPLSMCLVDNIGSRWWLDGDYVRQINISYNEHSVWLKEGFYLSDYYIFLHTADHENEWYWAITTDPTFKRDGYIRSKCNSTNATDPSQCTQWLVPYRSPKGVVGWTEYEHFEILDDICQVEDDYICITSTQSNLAGLQGTYRLFNQNIPYWFREITSCDSTPGVLTYNNQQNTFQIYDSVDSWIVAICESTNITVENYKMNPELCKPFSSLKDNTLDETELIIDNTFTIQKQICSNI
eukprot:991314_1